MCDNEWRLHDSNNFLTETQQCEPCFHLVRVTFWPQTAIFFLNTINSWRIRLQCTVGEYKVNITVTTNFYDQLIVVRVSACWTCSMSFNWPFRVYFVFKSKLVRSGLVVKRRTSIRIRDIHDQRNSRYKVNEVRELWSIETTTVIIFIK